MENIISNKKTIAIIFLISLVSFVPRVTVSWHVTPTVWPDSRAYISIANSLNTGNGYTFKATGLKNTEYRAPLYPLLLTIIFHFIGKNIFFVQLIQCFLGVFTCLLVYGIGRRLFDARIGLLAAILAGVHPFLVYISAVVLTEQLFILWLMLVIYFLVRSIESHKFLFSLGAGISLGLGALTRPAMLAFVPFCAVYLLLNLVTNKRKRLLAVVLLFCGTFITISPWTLRNYIKHKEFIPISTAAGINFWLGNNEMANATDSWVQRADLPENMKLELSKTVSPKRIEAVYWKAAFTWIRENPKEFAKLWAAKFINFWRLTPDHVTRVYKQSWIPYGCAALMTFLYLFALLGMVVYRHRCRQHAILYFALLSFPVGLSFFITSFRFRIPLDPILILFASSTLSRILPSRWPSLLHRLEIPA